MLINFNNIYEFDKSTFGRTIFKGNKNAGEIYIIQNDYVNNNYYKIGITTDVRKRLGQYRVGNTYEWLDEDPLSRLALILLRCNTCPEISAKFSIIACNLQNVNFNKEFIFY